MQDKRRRIESLPNLKINGQSEYMGHQFLDAFLRKKNFVLNKINNLSRRTQAKGNAKAKQKPEEEVCKANAATNNTNRSIN